MALSTIGRGGVLSAVTALCTILAACSQGGAVRTGPVGMLPLSQSLVGSGGRLQHIVLVVQENRTFDNLFARFPGADGTTFGLDHLGREIPLRKGNLVLPRDLGHDHVTWLTEYDGGMMDGFDVASFAEAGLPRLGRYPYQYVDPQQIAPYWTLARGYTLADHLFQTQGSGSFTAHQDLIAGGTAVDGDESVIDSPSALPWGCDAPPGTYTVLITRAGGYARGPFPCFSYPTLRDVLDAKHVSWKYYTPPLYAEGSLWSAFDAIKAVRYGSEWNTNVTTSPTLIFSDIRRGRLASVSWVVPEFPNSDHPGSLDDDGPSWVASIVNAIGKSAYWRSTAILIVWDDWGGLYDHVPPPQLDYQGLGFRVPMIVVSPYARHGYVSHTQYEFGSIVRFIEDNWSLPRLGTTDVRSTSISDSFDFQQVPSTFVNVPAKHSATYFERQPPSKHPVDTE